MVAKSGHGPVPLEVYKIKCARLVRRMPPPVYSEHVPKVVAGISDKGD